MTFFSEKKEPKGKKMAVPQESENDAKIQQEVKKAVDKERIAFARSLKSKGMSDDDIEEIMKTLGDNNQ